MDGMELYASTGMSYSLAWPIVSLLTIGHDREADVLVAGC